MKLEPLLYVSDLKKSILFYTKILGFKIGALYPNTKNPTYAQIFIGNNKLMRVLSRKENKKYHQKGIVGSGIQFFIQVNNVDKKMERNQR